MSRSVSCEFWVTLVSAQNKY